MYNPLLDKSEYWEPVIPEQFRSRPTQVKGHMSFCPERTISRPLSILRAPTIYEIDFMENGADVFRKNGGLTWYEKMYTSKTDSPWFESKFPGELFRSVNATRADVYVDLTFSLGREDVKIRDFVDQYSRGSGEVVMSLSRERLEAVLGSVVDFSRQDYHALPLLIRVKSVHSTLPITMKCSFRSRVSKASPEEIRRQTRIQEEARNQKTALNEDLRAFPNVEWTHPQVTQNGTAGIVVMPRQKETFGQSDDTIVYMANTAVINGPDFPRWITVDFQGLMTLFGAPCAYEGIECYRLHPPTLTDTKFALHFWFFVEHFPLIRHLTRRLYGVDKDERLNGIVEGFIYTPRAVIQEIIRRRMTAFNKDALLMSFDELQLVAAPARGPDGWNDLRSILDKRIHFPNCVAEEDQYAQFSVTLTLAFEPYKITANAAMGGASSVDTMNTAVPLFDPSAVSASVASSSFSTQAPAYFSHATASASTPDSSSSTVLTPEQLGWLNMALAANRGAPNALSGVNRSF